MTVLAKYQRLEVDALWRPTPDDQRRDVIVGIGKATLTISAANGNALSHWSLPAIIRLNPGDAPALYAPGEGSPERLEVADSEMTEAIEKVLKAIQRGPGHGRSLRGLLVTGGALAVLVLGVLWVPGAITRYTASLVPEGARDDIGNRLLSEITHLTGAPCSDEAGLRALVKLEMRLFPDGGTNFMVVPSALPETAHLPDGTLLIGHRLVEDHETPDVLAGYLLAEDLRRSTTDPLEDVLENAGLTAALRLLTTGKVGDEALERHAENIVATEPRPVLEKLLIARLDRADVSGSAYAYAIDFSGETTMPLIEASQKTPAPAPLLGDGDWIALQRICED